ncbi:MAG TPA: glycosyltransferase [Steroidobacteraceae bacterium]|nr:glycosyltransferase [Steroidobacteraceae bacterium]
MNNGSGSTPALVSVVMPTFNRLQFLPAAIGSVFNQTFTDWELIIADDGSEARTQEYLHSLKANPRVTITWMSHTGSPAAVRNAALQRARGEYIAFLDSDDIWENRKLELQLAKLRSRKQCQWSYTAFTNVDRHGDTLPEESRRRWIPCEGDIFDRMLRGEVSIRTPSVLVTRLLLSDSGAFDESMRSAEDYDLWLRLALRSEVVLLDQSLVRIRAHQENHSADWSSAYVGQDHTFKKLQSYVDPQRRSMLQRERVRNALKLASEHATRRSAANAWRALLRSLSFSWRYAEWWKRGSRIVLRTFLPEYVLEGFRRRRGRVT